MRYPRVVFFSIALASVAPGASSCAAPIQNGTIVVLPGATERLIVAMELGYRGVGDVKPPAAVRRITSSDELVAGSGASGRIGDYLLENGSLVAIVSALDASGNGGNLIDVAREPGPVPDDPAAPGHLSASFRGDTSGVDELGTFKTRILGAPVRYTTLKTGKDAETGAAYVEVSGLAGNLGVSTRYDVAPDVDAVLVHTSFTRPAPPAEASPDEPLDIADDVVLASPEPARLGSTPSALALYGTHAAYAVVPLSSDIVTVPNGSAATIGIAAGRAPEGLVVYTRLVSPLERADSLAFETALAVSRGEQLGDVEIDVAPTHHTTGETTPPGALLFRQASPAIALDLRVGALHVGDVVRAKAPAGAWDVSFEGGAVHSPAPTPIVVRAEQVTRATVVAAAADR